MSIARKEQKPCPELIKNVVRQERNRRFVLSVILLFLSICAGLLMGQNDPVAGTAFAILAMIFLLAGFLFLYEAVKNLDPEKSEIVQMLTQSPKSIVWVYSVVTETSPLGVRLFRSATMYFKLNDGGQITMKIPTKAAKKVSESLNVLLSHATFGYSPEKEQWFIAEPRLLYRD